MATRTGSSKPRPNKKQPTVPAGHHPEHCNSRHDSPHEVHERIEHLEHHIHKLIRTVEEITMKFEEAFGPGGTVPQALDRQDTRIAALEAGAGNLTPAQEQTVTDLVTRIDNSAPVPTP